MPITEYNLFLFHGKECSPSISKQSQSLPVNDIFDLTEECEMSGLVEDATLHAIRFKITLNLAFLFSYILSWLYFCQFSTSFSNSKLDKNSSPYEYELHENKKAKQFAWIAED